MSKSRFQIPVLLLATAALAACEYNHRRSYVEPTYRPSLFNYAAGGRDPEVQTVGNHAEQGLGDQEFPEFIVASMQGHNLGQRTNFTTAPVRHLTSTRW